MPSPMRRNEYVMDESKALDILEKSEYGVMAVILPEGIPYVVPLNFVLIEKTLWAHCATEGQKLDAISGNPNVCINVVACQQVQKEQLTTHFDSVTAFGVARIGAPDDIKQQVLELLCDKYSPEWRKHRPAGLTGCMPNTQMIAIEITSICGKAKWPMHG